MKRNKSIVRHVPLFIAAALLIILTGCVNPQMSQLHNNIPVRRVAKGRNGMDKITITTPGFSTLSMLHKAKLLSDQGMLSIQDDAVRYIVGLVKSGDAMIFQAGTEVWWMDFTTFKGEDCVKVRKQGDLNEYWIFYDALTEIVYPNAPKGDNSSPKKSDSQKQDGQKSSVATTDTGTSKGQNQLSQSTMPPQPKNKLVWFEMHSITKRCLGFAKRNKLDASRQFVKNDSNIDLMIQMAQSDIDNKTAAIFQKGDKVQLVDTWGDSALVRKSEKEKQYWIPSANLVYINPAKSPNNDSAK